jgi:hypothetical protein
LSFFFLRCAVIVQLSVDGSTEKKKEGSEKKNNNFQKKKKNEKKKKKKKKKEKYSIFRILQPAFRIQSKKKKKKKKKKKHEPCKSGQFSLSFRNKQQIISFFSL